jgi:hypothetical protein
MSSRRLLSDGPRYLPEESDQLALFVCGQALQHTLCPGNPTPQRSLVERVAGRRERDPHDAAVVLRALPLNQFSHDEPIHDSGRSAEWHPNAPGELTHGHRPLCADGVKDCNLRTTEALGDALLVADQNQPTHRPVQVSDQLTRTAPELGTWALGLKTASTFAFQHICNMQSL